MKRLKNIWPLITGVLIFQSCYYNNEETLYPELSSDCDTINVTYSNTILPIMNQYCLSCHSNSQANSIGGGIKFEDYADVKTIVGNNNLWGSVTHDSGYSFMPKGGGKLDNCTLQKIKNWIDDGAPNN